MKSHTKTSSSGRIDLGRASVETKGPIGDTLDTVGKQLAGISDR